MCNTNRGTDTSKGDTLVGGSLQERLDQREVDGQNQESIPRSDNPRSHQGMWMMQGLQKHTLTLAIRTNHMTPPLGAPRRGLSIHLEGKRRVQQPQCLHRRVLAACISIQVQKSRNR